MAFEVKIPRVGESIQEVTLAKWLKSDGDRVEVDESLCEIESDKTSFELPSERAGILKRIAQEGATLTIGGIVAEIEETAASAPVAAKPAEAPAAPRAEPPKAMEPPKEEKPAEQPKAMEPPPAAPKIPQQQDQPIGDAHVSVIKPSPAPKTSGDRSTRREKMTTLRKTISKRLVAVKNETAMLTTFNEVDMSAIMAIRSKYGESFKKKYGVKPGFVSFFVLFACEAIKSWPAINAKIDGDEIVYNNYCDIGIAVSTDRGLVVPPIRNADRMTIVDIEREIARLADVARSNKLTIDDLTGGTFTITNGGVFGSMLSTPILNSPQSAILGMHNIVERPVVVNGQIVIRPIMYVALSYDHRIIDGKEAVSFLVNVKQLIEEPARILLSL